ncbi:hypothetical protein K469DRAFT_702118 [Zopfia rhizophila CBS 207.26]|uniref:Uncharacterized protein n=1 Tax=Zopfia rhizophila CBS 207.26 TaxID=1314779 RepID=A0A6A6D937_9PEZI|nr:hypothetical protein K469DRAFT_702118 [Zopfia rhizophila CBS 207.26]
MTPKSKFFSWSKSDRRQPEIYRTGGLLPIDTSVGDTAKEAYVGGDAKNAPRLGHRPRPPNLTIIPDYNNHNACLAPASALHNAALSSVSSASNLLAVVNDMLRSPAMSASVCPGSAEIHKPLPSRPRSISLPSTPELLPAELPGSILLDNQGLPSPPVAGSATHSTMRSVRSGNSLSSSAASKPSPSKAHTWVPQHKKSLSEVSLQRGSKSRPNLISPSSTDSKITTCSVSTNGGQTSSSDSMKAQVGAEKALQLSPLIVEGKTWRKTGAETSNRRDELGTPTPTSTRSKRIEELKATITAQDNTISTLQAQFSSLRTSHESHIGSLTEAHAKEIATLKTYTRVLEEQQSQRTLHHASSNHLLLLLDTTEPQSPNREQSLQNTAGSTSATSIKSFQSALEQQTRSPHPSRDSPEMENLKRKLSSAKRPETGNRDTILQLNQYKQNNAALSKQIESLMAKLNDSKKAERTLQKTMLEWQEKVEQLSKSEKALQNTVDNLEQRLEMANIEKVDVQEQLFNLQHQRSPFDLTRSRLQVTTTSPTGRQSAHTSMSTVFSSGAAGSPTNHANESQEPTTLAAFITHIERLQDQIKQKDSRITELEQENEHLELNFSVLARDHKEVSKANDRLELHSDIQARLLKKTKETDIHIEQLRTAIIERESIIGEKEKSLRMAERQLEHHKLLLHAEIRRHATMSLLADVHVDPLPDLTSLASKDDIDRWTERLQKRLKKTKSNADGDSSNDLKAQIDDLRREVDFYVREIIYYKLDIKGYKSDIKKLKHVASGIGKHRNRLDSIDSPTPSFHSGGTPVRSRFAAGTPGLGISATPSPVSTGPISATFSLGRTSTPSASLGLMTPDPSPSIPPNKPTLTTYKRLPHDLEPIAPTPHTPPRKPGFNPANEADNMDPGVSPRSVKSLSPERRKPTPPSPEQEQRGDMATNFPLSTPAAPKRHDTQRSMSDSIIQLYSGPRTPEWSPSNRDRTSGTDSNKGIEIRGRSASLPDGSKRKATPERPPRPRYGLFESPITGQQRAVEGLPTPPRMDVMAEAMRNSPDRIQSQSRPPLEHGFSDPSTATTPMSSQIQHPHSSSSGSGSVIPTPLSLRPRAGSSSSSTAIPSAPPERKDSVGSGSNIPFVIAMGSPHNPALITPTTTVPPSTCSITGKSSSATSLKLQSSTSRTGVGGTMASSTPLTSPISPADTRSGFFGSTLPIAKGSASRTNSTSQSHSRNASVSSAAGNFRRENERVGGVRPGESHSRSVSGSSIMTAIQLPSSLIKGKGKARKESISHPTPLASPFDINRDHGGSAEVGSGNGYGIGEAV